MDPEEPMQIDSNDIPQAEELSEIRELVAAVREVGAETEALAELTGFSDRHVCYRLHAAKVLGLVDQRRELTARGLRLLATSPGGPAEREEFSDAVAGTRVVSSIVPDLLTASEFDLATLSELLVARAGLSKSTAERRARILASWRRQLQEEPA